MLTMPTGYFTEIQSNSRILDAYVVINGVTYYSDQVVELYFSHGVLDETYTVGNAPSAYVRCTLANIDASIVVDNTVIEPYVGVDVSGTMTYLKVGKFYIEESQRDIQTITVHAMDKMVQLEQTYVPVITYPNTLTNVLADVLSGISYSITLPAYLSSLSVGKLLNRTKRQMLGYIAELMGGFAYVDRSTEQIKIKVPSKTPSTASVQTIDSTQYFDLYREDNSLTISGINLTDGNTTWSSGTTSSFVLQVESPFAVSSIASNVLAQVTGTPMISFNAKFLGNPALELGDSVTVVEYNADETTTTRYLNIGAMEINFTANGFSATIKNIGEGKAKNTNPTVGDIISRFDYIDANKITTGYLSADFIRGGKLTVGGVTNEYSTFEVLDEIGLTQFYIDNATIQITNRDGFPILDVSGLNSYGTQSGGINILNLVTQYSAKLMSEGYNGTTYLSPNIEVFTETFNGTYASIKFSDNVSNNYAQWGMLRYTHVDAQSFGSANAFIFDGTETSLSIAFKNAKLLPTVNDTGVVGNSTYKWNNGNFSNLTVLNGTMTNLIPPIDNSGSVGTMLNSYNDGHFYNMSNYTLLNCFGKVGIGIDASNTNDSALLQLEGVMRIQSRADAINGNKTLIYHNASDVADYGLYLRHSNGTGLDALVSIGGYGSNVGRIIFATAGTGSTASTRMTIEPTGFVDIGTQKNVAQGTLTITPDAANTPKAASVTFPASRFSNTPSVVVTARSSVPGTQVTGVGVLSETTSGCTIYLTRTNTTSTGVAWVAIGI